MAWDAGLTITDHSAAIYISIHKISSHNDLGCRLYHHWPLCSPLAPSIYLSMRNYDLRMVWHSGFPLTTQGQCHLYDFRIWSRILVISPLMTMQYCSAIYISLHEGYDFRIWSRFEAGSPLTTLQYCGAIYIFTNERYDFRLEPWRATVPCGEDVVFINHMQQGILTCHLTGGRRNSLVEHLTWELLFIS